MAAQGFTGRLADLYTGPFLRAASVTSVTWLSDHFVEVGLQGEPFTKVSWVPGAKVQLRASRGSLTFRTYTPTRWDAETGETSLLAFVHGAGPGSSRFREVQPGDGLEVVGPRRSIDLNGFSNPVVFSGDETGVALALALRSTGRPGTQHVFESTVPEELTAVLEQLGLDAGSLVVPKQEDRAPLVAELAAAADRCADGFDLVVTGDAATVAAVRRAVRSWPRAAGSTKVKAYWAEGRTGLD